MMATTAHSEASKATSSGIVGDAYVASLTVTLAGDGTRQRLEMDGLSFEQLMTALEMRPAAFESRTRAFRAHHTSARTLIQRMDRLRTVLERTPALLDASIRLRDIAEMSDHVAWSAV